MKKIVTFLSVMALAAVAVFAEKNETFSVSSVVGKVTYEVSNGVWSEVTPGMSLDLNANVNVGLNSTLTVASTEGESYSIKPMKKGKLSELTSFQKVGVKVGSKITKADIELASNRITKGVNTASSRASEAKSDVEWDE